VKLYALPPSPNTFKVVALANHLGLELEVVNLDPASGGNKTPDYLAKNPNALMPTWKMASSPSGNPTPS